MRYAIIESGQVVNVVEWDGSTPWQAASAVALPEDSAVGPGYTYADGVFSPPFEPVSLAQAQAAQLALMALSYAAAIAQDVTFKTAAGVTQTYQADAQSVANAQAMVAAYSASGVPAGFYWISRDNTQVAFALADLQGLAKAMGDQGWAAFQHLQQRKAAIRTATTVAAVQAVLW